jgi:dihydrofolate reductase
MRKLTLIMSITVDGFIAKADGGLWDAFPWPNEMQQFATEFYRNVGTAIYSRPTYEAIVPWWQNVAEGRYPTDVEITDSEVELAGVLQQIEKVVFSRSLSADKVPDRVIEGNLVDEIAKLKTESGRMIALHGGASLVVPLLEVGLIDELLLFVSPAALGDGKPLFSGLPRELGLALIGSQVFDGTVVLLRYRPTGPASSVVT